MDFTPPSKDLHLGDAPARYKMSPATYKKAIKPLIEKKRRARINASLGQLKQLLLQTPLAQNPRTRRLEKADILELTVRQLEKLKRADLSAPGQDFMAGFSHCRRAMTAFLDSTVTLDSCVKSQILAHLDLAQTNPALTGTGPSHCANTEKLCVETDQLVGSGLWKEEQKARDDNFSVCEQVLPLGLARNIQHQSYSTPVWHSPKHAPHWPSQYCTPAASLPPTSSAVCQLACWGPVPAPAVLFPIWRPW
ncbi:transcription factor HES-5 [Microcaecilia unicolor]|uniref:Transcription factor HES-5-like n=1 Tax=Microcaecilia unicolor TaxID=1415580 RepID=A0A6P7X272_9AMPH|nr:transcription factor HES-5-like [Microcaecilia unicolor]XP_030044230.1 transcription factor HES-5-like [Microcaecilia unicolor]